MTETTLGDGLRAAIERCGYYPALVADSLATALAGEPSLSYVVQHEATFDRDELRRHVTVLALTPTRLVVSHTDEHPPDESSPVPYATTSTESVPLRRISSVVVSRVVSEPATFTPGRGPTEVVLTVGWGAVSRLDLEPASCSDPNCEADHGYTGTATADDFSLRASVAADGEDVVSETLTFAAALSEATRRAPG